MLLSNLFLRSFRTDWDKVPSHSFLHSIPAIRSQDEFSFQNPVTFFVGENGSGKSTLIEALAVAYGFNAEGGTLNYTFSTYAESHDLAAALHLTKGISRPQAGYFFRAESFFNVATAAEQIYGKKYGGERLHHQSHGESFLAFFQESTNRRGLYLMDEPEAALSPQRQLTLLLIIAEMAKNGSQFIIATHSPILLGLPGADIFSFSNGTLSPVSYEETESYQITKMFLENRERLLTELFEE